MFLFGDHPITNLYFAKGSIFRVQDAIVTARRLRKVSGPLPDICDRIFDDSLCSFKPVGRVEQKNRSGLWCQR